jgi:hypothetical protein
VAQERIQNNLCKNAMPSMVNADRKNKPPAARVAKPRWAKHLESGLRVRFTPRSSGQITSAFDSGLTLSDLEIPVYQTPVYKMRAKVWPPAGPPEASLTWLPPAER